MRKPELTANQLKILALIAMTLDHIGLLMMHGFVPFRIFGRLAFPIFAFQIAEGCRYTHHRLRYLLQIFTLGILCQIVLYLTDGSLYQGVLITFSLSILTIYAIGWAKSRSSVLCWAVPAIAVLFVFLLCEYLPQHTSTDFRIDYGFAGAMLPVLVSLSVKRRYQLLLTAAGLICLSLTMIFWQWYCLLALIPLALYSGKKGRCNLKYLFYIYYPLHLAVIYLIAALL